MLDFDPDVRNNRVIIYRNALSEGCTNLALAELNAYTKDTVLSSSQGIKVIRSRSSGELSCRGEHTVKYGTSTVRVHTSTYGRNN
jgi:hypothetical protein